MRRVEASGKTRKEAVEAALKQLRAELHEVKVEVLDEGSRGFLGLGARDVRVRVTLDTGEDIPEEVDEVTENRGADAAALLREMIERMKIKCTVRHEIGEGGTIRLSIDSPDSAILIGRKGKTLAALQYLINRMVNTGEDPDKTDRILVDIEGYLDRRRDSLEDLARRLAQRAKETGKRVRLKPLDPQERRIIHMALQDDPDVETYSVGNASVRSVIIQPKGMAKATDEPEARPSRREHDSARTSGGSDRSAGERSGRRRRGRGGRGRDRDGAASGDERTSETARPARAAQGERRESSGRGERRGEERPRSGERREGARGERRSDNGPRNNDGDRREGNSRRESGGRRRSGGGGRRTQESSPLTPRSSALLGNGPIQVRPRSVAPAPAPAPESADTPES